MKRTTQALKKFEKSKQDAKKHGFSSIDVRDGHNQYIEISYTPQAEFAYGIATTEGYRTSVHEDTVKDVLVNSVKPQQ